MFPAFMSCLAGEVWREMFSVSFQVYVGELLVVRCMSCHVYTWPLLKHQLKQNIVGKVAQEVMAYGQSLL